MTGKRLLFDPTELQSKVVTKTTSTGSVTRTYYLAPCLADASVASYRCLQHRWLQLSDLDSPVCANCQRMGIMAINYEQNIRMLQARQFANTSGPETIFMNTLKAFSLPFERQARIRYDTPKGERCYLVDFLVAGLIAVEVNGAYYPDMNAKMRRDEHLRQISPYPVVFFYETEMKQAPAEYYRKFEREIEDRLYFDGNVYQLQSDYAPSIRANSNAQ